MPSTRNVVDRAAFIQNIKLPFSLRVDDFQAAMQDVYDFFLDIDQFLVGRSLPRFDDMLRGASMSGFISDMITASLARHSRGMAKNTFPNGHPDLIVKGRFAHDAVQSGPVDAGIEIKTTRKKGGAVDTHGARDQWMTVFVYDVDRQTEPAVDRAPMTFREVYVAHVTRADSRRNARGELGTRAATLDARGLTGFRRGMIYDARQGVTRAAPTEV